MTILDEYDIIICGGGSCGYVIPFHVWREMTDCC